MSMKLYVGNLSFQTSSYDLEELFGAAGTVESASVVEDRETGRSRGFGFVEMASKEEGEKAIEEMHAAGAEITVVGVRANHQHAQLIVCHGRLLALANRAYCTATRTFAQWGLAGRQARRTIFCRPFGRQRRPNGRQK